MVSILDAGYWMLEICPFGRLRIGQVL